MGCFVSTHRDLSSASSLPKHLNSLVRKNQAPPRSNSSSSVKASKNRAPPEEETVKEILPEIHNKWKPRIANLDPQKPPQKPEFHKFPEVSSKINKVSLPMKKEEEISEVSEVCSLSDSMMSTTTIADRKEEDDEIRQRVSSCPAKMRKNRSFSGDRRERMMGKSPSRRPDQSPGRRNISARSTPSRDQVVRSQTIGSRGTRNEPRGRDAGENCFRRSRSPAMRTDNGATRSVVGRSPSKRRPNQSPARARTATPENCRRRKDHAVTEGKWPSSAANESLENPLVSLECFIFL